MKWRGNICVTEPDGSKKVIIEDTEISGIGEQRQILIEALERWLSSSLFAEEAK